MPFSGFWIDIVRCETTIEELSLHDNMHEWRNGDEERYGRFYDMTNYNSTYLPIRYSIKYWWKVKEPIKKRLSLSQHFH